MYFFLYFYSNLNHRKQTASYAQKAFGQAKFTPISTKPRHHDMVPFKLFNLANQTKHLLIGGTWQNKAGQEPLTSHSCQFLDRIRIQAKAAPPTLANALLASPRTRTARTNPE